MTGREPIRNVFRLYVINHAITIIWDHFSLGFLLGIVCSWYAKTSDSA